MEIGSNSSAYWQVGYAAPGSLEEKQMRQAEANGDAIHLDHEHGQDENKDFKNKLKQKDRDVRTHENAHMAAAGGLAIGGPNYTYQVGPDGEQHAVGGHVNLDIRKESTPEATIAKMQQVINAARAPSDPSNQDMAVAAAAMQNLQEARQELAEKNKDEREGKSANKLKIETTYKGGPMTRTFSATA
ncbi:MAG: hypothetical protein MK132_20770 [Lentisphaerales bacterium]|nr:hypothetical protein [Lentisphaerales bacterium]